MILAGERGVRVRTTARAPERFTVTLRFDLDARWTQAQMGAPYGVVTRPLDGRWTDAFHPAQDFFAPTDAAGGAPVVFASPGPPAWRASAQGRVEHMIVRNAPTETCEAYGSIGHDADAHTLDTALLLPADPASTAQRALAGLSFSEPLRARAADAHAGAGPQGGLLATDSDGVLVSVAQAGSAGTLVRLYRLDRSVTTTVVAPGFAFARAFAADALGTRGAALAVDGGRVTVPLAADVTTIVLD
jgi:hypothetical protein